MKRTGEIVLCALWVGAVAVAGGYAIHQGLGSNELYFSMLIGSVLTLGAYDTRKNQPTQYNLLRNQPFGSPADDEARGKQTIASHALQAMLWVSLWLCLCQILFGRH
jgi:hypothetical protein